MPRQPILSVLGHVDSGKTTLLDHIRESRICEGEEGGITQMIGATEVPFDTLEDVCGPLLEQLETDITIPGVLFIDTPGHAAFSSLRKRGGSISDIAVLVIDIEEGIQPQTEEAIDILMESGTPFVVALNKIDTITGWKSDEKMFTKNLRNQGGKAQGKLDERIYEIMGELNEYDIVADRFDRVDNFQNKVAMVPMSAMTGEGVPELLMVIAGLAQNYLSGELEVEEGIGQGTVLEVSQQKGMGTTIDVIHYDGIISSDDRLVYGTRDGVKETEIRALLEPRPLKEIREDKQYEEVEKVEPASGIKITGRDLEGVISGAPVRAASDDELEEARRQVEEELESTSYETGTHGVVVKADSLGSLEALMREVEKADIPVQKAEVGDVTKSDVAEVQNEDAENRAILGFSVGANKNAEKMLKDKNIEFFHSKIIYEILDDYTEKVEELRKQEREDKLESVSRPARIRLMPDHVFRSSNPVVAGTEVVKGVLTPGSKLMTPEGETIGTAKSIQEQNEKVNKAEKGSEVAVSITNATMGRDIEEGDILLVDITGEDFRVLNELDDVISSGEEDVLGEIVEIKDSKDPHWKLH